MVFDIRIPNVLLLPYTIQYTYSQARSMYYILVLSQVNPAAVRMILSARNLLTIKKTFNFRIVRQELIISPLYEII